MSGLEARLAQARDLSREICEILKRDDPETAVMAFAMLLTAKATLRALLSRPNLLPETMAVEDAMRSIDRCLNHVGGILAVNAAIEDVCEMPTVQ